MRFTELSLGAQTAYAELFEQTRSFELTNALAGLVGSFHQLKRQSQVYWYFGYRDLNQKNRMVYVGPDDERVRALVSRFESTRQTQVLVPVAQAAMVLGNTALAPKHFRIIKRLAEHGFFRAGGLLVGTHAFLALGNLLGVKWRDAAATLDVDFAHAGRNVSLTLPANLKIDVHNALESLEMGLLPMAQFSGQTGAHYRNPQDPELRLDFLTSATRNNQAVVLEELNLSLQPLKFMEFLLEGSTQACVFASRGACVVNLPSPERYAVHKLIVAGERGTNERAKSHKDLLQAACLIAFLLQHEQAEFFNATWRAALQRGKGWQQRLQKGQRTLLKVAPELASSVLWQ